MIVCHGKHLFAGAETGKRKTGLRRQQFLLLEMLVFFMQFLLLEQLCCQDSSDGCLDKSLFQTGFISNTLWEPIILRWSKNHGVPALLPMQTPFPPRQ
jgi:hypothetical protein